jgi:tryptophan synthase beta subunit
MKSEKHFGTVPNDSYGETIVSEIREIIKGYGYWVRQYGRNPNRAQYYPSKIERTYSGRVYKHYYCQNLPKKFSTSLSLYLEENKRGSGKISLKEMMGKIQVVKYRGWSQNPLKA